MVASATPGPRLRASRIVTVGGAISGYCATGSTCEAIRPASVMMIAITAAKIGRSMKKRDIRYFPVDLDAVAAGVPAFVVAAPALDGGAAAVAGAPLPD